MPGGATDTQSRRWIVQGDPVSSGELAKHVGGDPDIRQIAEVARDIVILSMTEARAKLLRSAFPKLIVEPDAALKQFGSD